MYSISSALELALRNGRKNIKVFHGNTALSVQSVTYTATMGDKLTVGAVNAACVVVRVYGRLLLGGEDITVRIDADSNAGSVPIGTFTVAKCETGDEITTLTAYDAVYTLLGGEYVPNTTTPPNSVLTVLADVATQNGLTLMDTTGITDVTVTGTLTGYTFRDIVGHMAALLGMNAYISRTGELSLRWYSDNGQTLGPSNCYANGLKLGESQTLTGLRMVKEVTTTTTDSDGITTETTTKTTYEAGSGTGVVIEIDNPFATQAIVNAVWTAIHAAVTTYRLGTCAFFGGFEVDPGDIISVTDMQSVTSAVTSAVPVMGLTLELDGGCRASIQATGTTETALTANVMGPTGRLLSKIEADLGAFKNLTAQNFTAEQARITNLYADQAWVKKLFAQSLTAGNLRVRGASTFEGVVDVVYGRIGAVTFASFDQQYTREESITLSEGEVGWLHASDGPSYAPSAERKRLVKMGVWVTKEGTTAPVNFRIYLSQSYPDVQEVFDIACNYNDDEIFYPVNSDAFDVNKSIDWDGSTWNGTELVDMGGATIHARLYYGDRGAVNAESDICTDTQFVEDGTPLAEKYASINHDHDGDYLALTGGTVDGDVDVTGDLTVTGEVTGSNIPIIQQGNTGPISGVSSVKTTATVTFNTPFPGVPKIMLTPVQNGGYMPTVKLETVSSSGFRLAITIPSGTTDSIGVDWMAIYV